MKVYVHLLAYDSQERRRPVEIPEIVVNKCQDEEDILNAVFYYGQNDFTVGAPIAMPSVSAGDIVFLGEKKFRVDDIGFSEMTEGEYAAYCDLPRLDRIFYRSKEKRYDN